MSKKPNFRREIVKLPDLQFMPKAAIDLFALPDGKERRWESLWYPEGKLYVATAAFTSQERLVLVRMFRFPIEMQAIELPGGGAETGEDFAVAAQRELLEETGYETKESLERLTEGYLYACRMNTPFVVFVARNCQKVQAPCLDDVEEFAGLKAIEKDPQEIMKEISEGNRAYSPIVSHALIALFWRGIIKT